MRRAWSGRSGTVVLALVMALGLAACSRVTRHFSGSTPTRHGVLTVTPPTGPAGSAFTLEASNFLPGEGMTFEIDVKGQQKFVGPRHVAGPDGKVTTQYTPQAGNPAGVYAIKAVGDRGTRASGTLTVVAGGAPTSTTR